MSVVARRSIHSIVPIPMTADDISRPRSAAEGLPTGRQHSRRSAPASLPVGWSAAILPPPLLLVTRHDEETTRTGAILTGQAVAAELLELSPTRSRADARPLRP